MDPPPGCRFAPRCPFAIDVCREVAPHMEETGPGNWAACHRLAESHRMREAAGKAATWRQLQANQI